LQTYQIKYAEISLPGKGYGARGQTELKLSETTVITAALAPIIAESRTFQDADVCLMQFLSKFHIQSIAGVPSERCSVHHCGSHS